MCIRDRNERGLFNFACVNARSLNNKSLSMVNLFEETDLNACALNETWMVDNKDTRQRIEDLNLGENISVVRRDRINRRGGGVAIAYHNKKMNLAEYKLVRTASPNSETVAAYGRDNATGKNVLIISVYLPPVLRKSEVLEIASDVSDSIAAAKVKHGDIVVFVAGDFNGKSFKEAIADYPDIKKLKSGPTRKNKCLDLIYTNAKTTEILTLDPLATEHGIKSDHKILYTSADLIDANGQIRSNTNDRSFQIRRIDNKRKERFTKALLDIDWICIEKNNCSDSALALSEILDGLVDQHFPKKTIRLRGRDLPWITPTIRRAIRKRKRRYKKHGRDAIWKEMKKETDRMIGESKKRYVDRVEEKCRIARNSQAYFQAIKRLNCKEAPVIWNIMQMFPNLSAREIAEKVAAFFNSISNEYEPLLATEINTSAPLRRIEMYEVAARLRSCKKPKAQVPGDIPSLSLIHI